MDKIKIGVDAFPYNKDVWSISDYSGEQIFNKIALPLFYYEDEDLKYLAAKSHMYENEELIIFIRKDLYWNNGERIVAEDYCRGIKHVLASDDNRYKKLLLSVISHPNIINKKSFSNVIRFEGNEKIIISLAWYDPFILHYLAKLNFSPKHEVDKSFTGGPYWIKEVTDRHYKLMYNKYYTLDGAIPFQNVVKKIVYYLIEEDLKASRYYDNTIDVSCDTGLDLIFLKESKNLTCFYQSEERLVMLLSPGDKFHELPKSIIDKIARSIDRKYISHQFDNVLSPLFSWMSLYDLEEYEFKLDDKNSKLENKITIDISYEDFYPNKNILEYISHSLNTYNITLNLNKDEYGKWYSSCHFRMEIRKVPKHNPILLLRSDLSKLSKNSKNYKKLKNLYRGLYVKSNVYIREDLFSILDLFLRKEAMYIPLFIFPTGYFCKPQFDNQSLMNIGSFVKFKEDGK